MSFEICKIADIYAESAYRVLRSLNARLIPIGPATHFTETDLLTRPISTFVDLSTVTGDEIAVDRHFDLSMSLHATLVVQDNEHMVASLPVTKDSIGVFRVYRAPDVPVGYVPFER